MKRTTLFFTLLATISTATPALCAQKDLGIAAAVGADAISSYDVDNRIKYIVATSGFSGSPEAIARLRPEVVRTLIDEKLEIQEARKNNINVSDQDVLQAIAGIEADRGMPPGTIFHILDSKGVPRDTFAQQIQAQLLWHNLLMSKIRPHVHVSDLEIDIASKKIAAATSAPEKPAKGTATELKIAVITLPVDKESRESEIKQFGEKLVGEIHHGASFEEMARQFSSETATAGGKVESFWIKPAQLDPKVVKALGDARAGSVAGPVRTSAGFTIIKVYDTRGGDTKPAPKAEQPQTPKDTEVYLKSILLKAKSDTGAKEADAMLQIGEEVAKHPGTCEEKGIASIDNVEEANIDVTFVRKPISELTSAVQSIVGTLKVGDISAPFASYEGIRLYMLCDKKEIDAKPVDRDLVANMLFQQKMQLEAQKYLRNLRREAFVDVR